jgi:hypothetical protein
MDFVGSSTVPPVSIGKYLKCLEKVPMEDVGDGGRAGRSRLSSIWVSDFISSRSGNSNKFSGCVEQVTVLSTITQSPWM